MRSTVSIVGLVSVRALCLAALVGVQGGIVHAQVETAYLAPSQGQLEAGIAFQGDRFAARQSGWISPCGQSAVVFEKAPGGVWVETAVIGGGHGVHGISLDGFRIAVGSPCQRTAYIYEPVGSSWFPIGIIGGAGVESGFGEDLAIQQDTLVVGADGHFGIGLAKGGVYIYEFMQGSWQLVAPFKEPTGKATNFGGSVALDGDLAVAGSTEGAYVMERSPTGAWSLVAKLEGDTNTVCVPQIAVEGGTIAMTDRYEVFVFERGANGEWNKVFQEVPSDGEGVSNVLCSDIAIDNGRVVVAADRVAWVYEKGPSGWAEVTELNWFTSGPTDIGQRVAMRGDEAALLDADGHARVFDLSTANTSCGQVAKYGPAGNASSAKWTPKLYWQGCVGPGLQGNLIVAEWGAGMPGVIVVGAQGASAPVGAGCFLNVSSPISTAYLFAMPQTSTTLDIPVSIPPSAMPGTLALQAFLACDPCPLGFANTVGLEIKVP